MLIRFVLKNLFSFKEETEFNLLPGRVKRLNKHKYERNGIEILKLTALYGANGSGKSNLIRSISLLRNMLLEGNIPPSFNSQKFKLSQSSLAEPIELAIEFFANNLIYYYSISINNGIVIDEYFSSNDKNQNDELIFHRIYENDETSIKFFNEFEASPENKVLKGIIEKDLLKKNQPLFTLLNSISNHSFIDIQVAYAWFLNDLTIIDPTMRVAGLAGVIDTTNEFKAFASDLMSSFNTGIVNVKVDVKSAEDFFGKDYHRQIDAIKDAIKDPLANMVATNNTTNEQVTIVNDNGDILVKQLLFEHKGDKNEPVDFKFEEESDGTKRLLEYIPLLNNVVKKPQTYIVDEIERSIHPLIVKELTEKFSKDESTKGQLIFSTHESNLLDQEIFRTDEIWFAEKNLAGSTKLYSLSDFKEHNTIDIRKGYLNGRYGAIPFIGNLRDLNWDKFKDEKE